MTRLILARHGNTFEPGETPVWVGANEDLPLARKGLEQSQALGRALCDADARPAHIISGPLKRTRRAAEIVQSLTETGGTIEIDERLKEIDYGSWGGRSDDEITASWGEVAITNWREKNIRPEGADWSPAECEIESHVNAVLGDALKRDGVVLIVTSNGILRYFHKAMGFQGDAKVKTGHVCGAQIGETGLEPLFWNHDPVAGLPPMAKP